MISKQAHKEVSAAEARGQAQQIAFAPIMFQAVRLLWKSGILAKLHNSNGLSEKQLSQELELSSYAIDVLASAGISAGVITRDEGTLHLTKTGYFVYADKMTNVNMDFVHDVCYEGMHHLEEAIKRGRPEGLQVFGEWDTIYEALSSLPPEVRKSWLAFDHYYSDSAFPEALKKIFQHRPTKIMDIGGNTGRWALACVNYDPSVNVTILDLPGQLRMMKARTEGQNGADRISGEPFNLFDESKSLPSGYDAIWMSQFLDCFSGADIISLLIRARHAMSKDTRLYILETFTDRQRFSMAEHSLVMTSLYFTCMANGNSKMYRASEMIGFVKQAGLVVEEEYDDIGISHTLLVCRAQSH